LNVTTGIYNIAKIEKAARQSASKGVPLEQACPFRLTSTEGFVFVNAYRATNTAVKTINIHEKTA
jgi:hypothetical protein